MVVYEDGERLPSSKETNLSGGLKIEIGLTEEEESAGREAKKALPFVLLCSVICYFTLFSKQQGIRHRYHKSRSLRKRQR